MSRAMPKWFTLPGPDGINTIDAGPSMPPTDAIYIYNMLRAEYGLRTRLGWAEWCTGLTGAADNSVRSVIPYTGSAQNGSNNKLFACTSKGIWDCTASSNAPTLVATFQLQGGDAGWGVGHVMSTQAGRFLMYCDEVNGYWLYAESSNSWQQITQGFDPWLPQTSYNIGAIVSTAGYTPWQPSTQYFATGAEISNGGNTYGCISRGTSAAAPAVGPSGTGASINDGSVIWKYLGPALNGNAYVCVSGGNTAANTVNNWTPGQSYTAGQEVSNGGNTYACTVGGISSESFAGGPAGMGSAIVDGTVTWKYLLPYIGINGPSGTGTSYPSGLVSPINDGTAQWKYLGPNGQIAGVDPTTFCHVAVFQGRAWFTQRDTSIAWYLEPGSVFAIPFTVEASSGIISTNGQATPFDFGPQFRAGGSLVGLYPWSYDGGGGMTTNLVGISTGGDVVIYAGTDPSDITTFYLKGVWFMGGAPYGRRIATDFGGDTLLLSPQGVVPLSKLVIGNSALDRSQYATAKISNLFNTLFQQSGSYQGWSVKVHPNDNALMVLVPQIQGQPTLQLVMSFATKGWSQYRDLPMLSAEAWNGQLYFGTTDGRVCVNRGYVDGVLLADPTAWKPVLFSVQTAFSNLESGRQKKIKQVRPIFLTEGSNPNWIAQARFKYDFTEAAGPTTPGAPPAGVSLWDSAVWDAAASLWGGSYQPQQTVYGCAGMGTDVSVAIAGAAIDRTSLVSIDVLVEQGGMQ